jgi:formate-dependent nitrite reductase membrane component NrfD
VRHVPEPEGRRGRRRPSSYYGVPPIHKPHWKWLIVSYFFLGGLSAGSYVVATAAELAGRPDDRDTVRIGRYLSLLAVIPCPVLLILDLGRPERFLNMLRVLKLRSPMSLGTWGLLAFSGFSTLSAAAQAGADGWLGRHASVGGGAAGRPGLLRSVPRRVTGVLGAPFGFFVGGYTGVLLGATAVPVWAKNARLLGPLFLSSAVAVACAAISLVLALLPGRRHGALERLHRAETVAAAAELLAVAAVHLNSGNIGRPLAEGRLGRLHLAGSVGLGIGFPIVLHVVGPALRLPFRLVVVLASVASLVGGFVMKYAVVMAGHASADDPAATFEFAGGQQRLAPAASPPSRGDAR